MSRSFEVGMGHGNRLQPNRRSIVEPDEFRSFLTDPPNARNLGRPADLAVRPMIVCELDHT
jgi:hypothetical protein